MKTAILIDGANTHGASKAAGYSINWKAVPNYFKGTAVINYYTALIVQPDGTNHLRELIDWLSFNGFHVVTKEAKLFTDEQTGLSKIKGNMDVEMCVDAMLMSDYVERLIFFTGDGDFTHLVKAVRLKGVNVTVVSTKSFCADELRRCADTYFDLEELRPYFEREFNGEAQGRRQHLGQRRTPA